MSQKARGDNAKTFELPALLYDLTQRASARLGRRDCYKSDDCAAKLVMRYLFERRFRGTGRCTIDGSKITINFPGARDPLLVLYKLLAFEVLAFKRECEDCNGMGQFPDDPDGGPKRIHPSLIEPLNPETEFEMKELFERLSTAFPSEVHREAFEQVEIDGIPRAEVAARFNINVPTLRQWICRDKRRIREVLLHPEKARSRIRRTRRTRKLCTS